MSSLADVRALAGNTSAGNTRNGTSAWTKRLIEAAVGLMAVVVLSQSAYAGKLVDVIPGLFGGDGIGLATPNNEHAAQFTSPDGGEFQEIGNAIASGVNLFAGGAVVSSFTFDPSQAVFIRSDEGLGSMLADLADTIGRGNISFGMSYTRFDFKSFEGEDLNSIEVEFDHADLCAGNSTLFPNPNQAARAQAAAPMVAVSAQLPSAANEFCFLDPTGTGIADPNAVFPSPNNPNFERDGLSAVINVKLSQEVFAFFANYGVLENWDVGVLIPVVHTNLSVSALASINRSPLVPNSANIHNFCTSLVDGFDNFTRDCGQPGRDLNSDFRAEDAWGLGDVELRSKYQFLDEHEWAPDTSILARVRFPTGDEDDFLGAGFTTFSGALILSRTISIFTPHVNVGIELTTGPGSFDNVHWVAGSTAKIHDRVTVAADFIGRHALEDDGIGDDILEFGVSMKVNPFSSFNVIGSAILPLNYRTGLRTAVTWGIGFEHTF